MKILSIKRLVLTLLVSLGSVMTLPAYAWPDTDEMNMCGAAVKNVRVQANDFSGWAEHDLYVSNRGLDYYYRTNCPESKATKNYKGKNWTPGAKMRAKPATYKKVHKKHAHKQHKKHAHKHHKKHSRKNHGKHNTHHKNHADCIRTDRLNSTGPIVKKAAHRAHINEAAFYRQAQAVLNMSKVKPVANVVHNPKHKNHKDCVRTAALNNSGAIVRTVRNKYHK